MNLTIYRVDYEVDKQHKIQHKVKVVTTGSSTGSSIKWSGQRSKMLAYKMKDEEAVLWECWEYLPLGRRSSLSVFLYFAEYDTDELVRIQSLQE